MNIDAEIFSADSIYLFSRLPITSFILLQIGYFCWAKLNQIMLMSPPPQIWKRLSALRAYTCQLNFHFFHTIFFKQFNKCQILQFNKFYKFYNSTSVTIFNSTSFAQPQSKCLLLFLQLPTCSFHVSRQLRQLPLKNLHKKLGAKSLAQK
jgi:hypothetical protein